VTECECVKARPFPNARIPDAGGVGALHKKRHRLGDNSTCVRHIVLKTLCKAAAPPELYPNMAERVADVIAGR